MKEKQQPENNRLLIQYAGFTAQVLVSLGVAIYAGIKLDEWIRPGFPLFVWLLPLIVIIAIIIRAVKDTSKK